MRWSKNNWTKSVFTFHDRDQQHSDEIGNRLGGSGFIRHMSSSRAVCVLQSSGHAQLSGVRHHDVGKVTQEQDLRCIEIFGRAARWAWPPLGGEEGERNVGRG